MAFTFQDIALPQISYNIQISDDPMVQEWRLNAHATLSKLKDRLAEIDVASLGHDDLASIAAIAVPVNNESEIVTRDICKISLDITALLPTPTLEVIISVLSKHIKPCFLKTPHSLINSSTGRKRSRPAGGPSAALDFYENQEWKAYPGISALLSWCLICTPNRDYEHIWHLIVPPIMTLLDDYESFYKLEGIKVVTVLLDHAPPELLKRTGVDGLLMTSLKTALLHLHSPLTPKIILASVSAHLKLINLTTTSGSQARFEQLSALLGEGIIGGVWLYAYHEWETIEASMIATQDIVRNLGVGTIRYLKALISQLVLNISAPSPHQFPMQLASLRLLEVVICAARPRINYWANMIVEGLARSWVILEDNEFANKQDMQCALRKVARLLAETCPSVVANEYDHLLTCDPSMFQGLLASEPVVH